MVHRLENGRPNVIYHLIQRRSRRARPTRRPQSHQAPRWTRKCTGFDHQYAAHPPPSRGAHEDCSMRACCTRLATNPSKFDPIKYWTGTAISNHSCVHGAEPATDHLLAEANSNAHRGGCLRRAAAVRLRRATQPVATDGGGELTTASTAAARSGGPRTGEASRRAGRRVF